MNILQSAKRALKTNILNKATNREIVNEMKKRNLNSAGNVVAETIPSERAISLDEWRQSIDLAKSPYTYSRFEYYRVCDNVMMDLHLISVVWDRILKGQGAKYKLKDASGKEVEQAKEMLQANWYQDYIQYAIESIFYGFSLVELYDQSDVPKLIKGLPAFNPMHSVKLVPRPHVRPELNRWLKHSFDGLAMGYDYTQAPDNMYYLPIGKPKDLGLLASIAPIALASRYALGAWGEFDEKLGIPFRWITMQGTDNKREKLLGDVLRKMGSAGWAVLREGEKVELLDMSKGDPHKCFKELIELCDKKMSKAVLGNTMTKDAEGGQYKGDVHADSQELRHLADLTFIKYLNNEELFPRLAYQGYPIKGLTYDLDETTDLSPLDAIAVDMVLLQYYNIDPKYIAEKYDVPLEYIQSKSPADVKDLLTEQQKKKDGKGGAVLPKP